MDIPTTPVPSVAHFIGAVSGAANQWRPVYPWFRGEPSQISTPLTPKVFRPPKSGFHYDENNLLQSFRRRAHLLNLPIVPKREDTDQWLFLARHVGLPTRLLDWTEGALIALYFSLSESQSPGPPDTSPFVWMLNPWILNQHTMPELPRNVFPLTWHTPSHADNPAFANIQAAWRLGEGAKDWPVAIEPTNIHPRMNAQHSYFTVHGHEPFPVAELVRRGALQRFQIVVPDQLSRDVMFRELRMLGIARSTILPDAEALSAELEQFLIVADGDDRL